MWTIDTEVNGWMFFKGKNYYFGWDASLLWVVNFKKSLDSFDYHEVPCSNKEVVDRFITESEKKGIELKPFDLEKINLLNVVDTSFKKTIQNLQYEIRNTEIDKILNE